MADESLQSSHVSVEELRALSDEIASLVRAGVPLEVGLGTFADDSNGALNRLTDRLVSRLRQGMTLSDAFEAEGTRLPAAYRAIVESGLRTGRLPEALEAISDFASAAVDLRHCISLALLYPFLVVLFAYALFVTFILGVAPRIQEFYTFVGLAPRDWMPAIETLGETITVWGPLVPLVLLGLAVLWCLSSRHLLAGDAPGVGLRARLLGLMAFGGLPGTRSVLTNYRLSNLAHLMSILLEHETPLHEAMALAADATGGRRVVSGTKDTVNLLANGTELADALGRQCPFPAFMRWMMVAGNRQGKLAMSLRQVAEIYRRRAQQQSLWLQLVAPTSLMVVVGGGATLIYALTVFVPLSGIWNSLMPDPTCWMP